MKRREFIKKTAAGSATMVIFPRDTFCNSCGVGIVCSEGEERMGQDDLEKNFKSPPPLARPWVYWFALDGNITSEGITADLEAMARVGFGGVLFMEVDQGAPKGPVTFAGAEWRKLFKHLCSEADRLGLKVYMGNDAGFTGSGGPWITPEYSMQKLVWSEAFLQGPAQVETVLPQPESISNYYRDVAVLAFPTQPAKTPRWSRHRPRFPPAPAILPKNY